MANLIPHTVLVIDKLRSNCHIGKHKHFRASTRGRRYHVWYGVPTIIISVALGSAFFVELQSDLPEAAKWAGAGFALLAALLSGIQTFFNFRGEYETHRDVGNRYLHLARECERLVALYFDDQIKLNTLSARIQQLNEMYAQITSAAEGVSTNKRDFKVALTLQKKKEQDEPSLVQRMMIVTPDQTAQSETRNDSAGSLRLTADLGPKEHETPAWQTRPPSA
jgi:hypothetical protein